MLPLLPGVSRHPERSDHYVVSRAGGAVNQVFAVFGYRHVRMVEERLVFSRRRPNQTDLALPAELAGWAREDERG